jgi:hypothetical protein
LLDMGEVGDPGDPGEVGDTMMVKLLGRQPRLESLEATTSCYLVVASLFKEQNSDQRLVRYFLRVKKILRAALPIAGLI